MNKRLIIGNWKMNPGTLVEAKKIAIKIKRISKKLQNSEVVICPPLPFITNCVSKKNINNFHVGVQTVSVEEEVGPYTGEVNARMINSIGAEYVIVGHSEERARGDSNVIVSKKLINALNAGLISIVCIGEKARDEGGLYLEELKNQIKESIANISKKFAKDIIIAYEPIWAIGAQEPMMPEQIFEMSLFAKKAFSDIFGTENGLKVKVLYGGAVNFRNAVDIINIGKVNGLLIGRESVNTPGFIELIKAVDKIS